MGVFDTIAGASAPSGSGVYIAPGDYLVELLAVKLFKSSKDGSDIFVVESKVVDVRLAYDGSNKVGETVSLIKNLTKQPKMAASDVKVFVAAAAEMPFDMVTAATVEKAVEDDGAAFAGLLMEVHAFNRKTKAGGDFTVVQWAAAEEEEDEIEV